MLIKTYDGESTSSFDEFKNDHVKGDIIDGIPEDDRIMKFIEENEYNYYRMTFDSKLRIKYFFINLYRYSRDTFARTINGILKVIWYVRFTNHGILIKNFFYDIFTRIKFFVLDAFSSGNNYKGYMKYPNYIFIEIKDGEGMIGLQKKLTQLQEYYNSLKDETISTDK